MKKFLVTLIALLSMTVFADNSTYTGPYLVKTDNDISTSFNHKITFECKVYLGAVVITKNIFGVNLTERKDIFFSPEVHALIQNAAAGEIGSVRTVAQDSEISYYGYYLNNSETASEVLLKKIEKKEIKTNLTTEADQLLKITDLLCD